MSDELVLLAQDMNADSGASQGRMVNGTIVSRSGNVVKVDIGGETVDAYSGTSAGLPVGAQVQIAIQQGTASVVQVISGPAGGVPVGAGMDWFTGTPPAGWLLCDGSTFSATSYPDLFAVLGTTTLPDTRGRFVIGASATYPVGSTGGSATHTITTAEMPSHSHAHPHTHTTGMAIGTIAEGTTASRPSIMFPTSGGTNTGPESVTNTNTAGSGNAMNILNPYLSATKIIYAGAVAA